MLKVSTEIRLEKQIGAQKVLIWTEGLPELWVRNTAKKSVLQANKVSSVYANPWVPVHTGSVGRCSYLKNFYGK